MGETTIKIHVHCVLIVSTISFLKILYTENESVCVDLNLYWMWFFMKFLVVLERFTKITEVGRIFFF